MKNKDMENKIKTVVPTLRFPEFRGTEGWIFKSLDSLVKMRKGEQVNKSILRDQGLYPVINGGIAPSGYYDYYNTDANTITISEGGNSCGYVSYITSRFWCGGHCFAVIVQKEINAKYIYHLLKRHEYNIMQLRVGSGLPNIQYSDLRKYSVFSTSIYKEQQKIADCLSSLDDLIEATTKKVEALKEHKKGLMQRLFPAKGKNVPDLRFPEFQGTSVWEEKKLGKIGNFIGGGTPNTTNPEYWDGEILWYTPTEIKNGYLKSSNRKITKQGLKNSSAKLLPKGAILITTRATIGDVAISKKECTTNQGFQSLVVNDSEINLFWFYWIIQHKEELIKKASGSTFKEIGKNEIINIIAYSAKKQEQQKIADCLSSIDELIEATTRKIEVLKEHKKGLMQQLFPKI